MKSPAKWQEPASDKASAAAEAKQLKVGTPQLTCKDGDWLAAGKDQGRGFSNCAVQVNRYSDNPAALKTRDVPVHDYKLTDSGAGSGQARTQIQNWMAAKSKR
jgi:hypothetical protein